jgi:hypothetical protein
MVLLENHQKPKEFLTTKAQKAHKGRKNRRLILRAPWCTFVVSLFFKNRVILLENRQKT